MEFLVEVVANRISTWNGILFSVKVNGYLGFKCTFRAQIGFIKITFQNHMNNREDPDPVRKGTGSSVMYSKYVFFCENRNSVMKYAVLGVLQEVPENSLQHYEILYDFCMTYWLHGFSRSAESFRYMYILKHCTF